MKLNNEERKIVEDYEKGKLKTRNPTRNELNKVRSVAANTFKKDRRITIRLYDHDFKGIQKRALEMGIPYQTLISSMIHRYVEGDLVEK